MDAADTLRDLLEMWGHAVRVVYDGPTALAAVGEFQPQVLLCDIGLPGMDGYAVARQVSQAEGSAATLVALTGYGQEQDRQRAQQAGFAYHLVKPVNIEELQRVLAETARQVMPVSAS